MDNVDKYNKNKSFIVSSSELGKSVIFPPARGSAFLWGFALLCIALVLSVILTFLLPLLDRPRDISVRFPSSTPQASTERNSTLRQDVELLKGQMNVLITGAMESKIQHLEKSLQSGIITTADLQLVREVKEDLKTLKAFSARNASTNLSLIAGTEKVPNQPDSLATLYTEDVLHEISNLRTLLYISIASCGFAILVLGGAWLRSFYRLKQIQNDQWFGYQMLEKPKSRHY